MLKGLNFNNRSVNARNLDVKGNKKDFFYRRVGFCSLYHEDIFIL